MVNMNDVSVWFAEYSFRTPSMSNCKGFHFIRAIDNESESDLQDRVFSEIDAELKKNHEQFEVTGGSINPHIMKSNQ